MNVSIEAQIKCPYYIRERTDMICCEGFVENTCMTTKFPDRKEKIKHVRKFCFLETGGSCPLAKKLNEKYSERFMKEQLDAIKRAAGKAV